MSLTSSTATLAQQTQAPAPASKPSGKRRASHGHTVHRRASEHHAHGHRRPSHGPGGHTGLGGLGGLTALTTTVSNGSDGSDGKTKRRSSRRDERPPARASRSDTHLPRLSRVNSSTSTTSHKSMSGMTSRTPPTTTVIQNGDTLASASRQDGKTKDEEDEGDWESGEEADEKDTGQRGEGSTEMRRTASDPTAASELVESPEATSEATTKPSINPLQTKKRASSVAKHSVLGFGGLTRTPMTEEPATLERESSNPGYTRGDEPGHVGIVPPAKRAMSSVNLHTLPSRKPSAELKDSSRAPAPLTPDDDSDTDATEVSDDSQSKAAAPVKAPTPLRKQASQRQVAPHVDGTSPTKLNGHPQHDLQSQKMVQHTQFQPEVQTRSRVASQNHTLRHRPSYSSLRSTHSFRAPPHPLNSPSTAGFVMTAATVGMSSRQRVSSMQVPPIAPAEVSTAVAEGHGWEGLPDDGVDVPRHAATSQRPNHMRKSSVSSNRSIRSLFAPQQSRHLGPVTDGLSANGRLTALAATTAASKLHTTRDPQLYHSSLGYSVNEAETAHLISRFLPVKESQVRRQSVLGDSPFASGHRSLVETMKHLGIGTYANASNEQIPAAIGMGVPEHVLHQPPEIKWKGKTPLELSLDRCWSLRVERGIDAGILQRAPTRVKSSLGPFRGDRG